MGLWVFGYGSLIWKAGFAYEQRIVGFIKGYRRVFYQGSTDHRGTPEYPGRTVTLDPHEGEVCYLEVREKQYDLKAYVDFYTDMESSVPAITGVLVYIGSADKKLNKNYLGPAPLEEMANQIANAVGPSGPNRDYLFQLDHSLLEFGCQDDHIKDLADAVRKIISGMEEQKEQS